MSYPPFSTIPYMEYLMTHLDGLVQATIISKTERALSVEAFSRILAEVLEETKKLEDAITKQVFTFTREKEIELFIKNYQAALTATLDKLYSCRNSSSLPEYKSFYDEFCTRVLTLLLFIEERFSKYFDRTEKIPVVYLALAKKEIRIKMDEAAAILYSDSFEFLEKIMNGLNFFFEHNENISYRQMMYRRELIKELCGIDKWTQEKSMYKASDRLLIYINYNDKEYVNFLINRVVREINGCSDYNDKIDRILLYSKELNQMQIKPESALHADHPTLKTQLGNWFEEELYYMERKFTNIAGDNPSIDKMKSKIKIVCNLSVDQLGIFFRAATDAKYLSTTSQRAFFEQIAPFISSAHKTDISPDSIRSKSYSPEKKDIETMKDVLMDLYKRILRY
jgi:uncharacterized protein YaaR (DUF327 family)